MTTAAPREALWRAFNRLLHRRLAAAFMGAVAEGGVFGLPATTYPVRSGLEFGNHWCDAAHVCSLNIWFSRYGQAFTMNA